MNCRGKFMSLALAALIGLSATVSAATNTGLHIKTLKRGEVSAALLRKAQPYKRQQQQPQQQQQQQQQQQRRRADGGDEFEITGDYNVKFSECVNLKTNNENLFDDDIISYAKKGYVTSAKSYVIFQVCNPDECYYEAEDNLYIVDLVTWVESTVQYFSKAKQNYCNACEEFENYCNPQEEEEEEEEEEEAEEEENDEEREDEEEDNEEEEGDEEGEDEGEEGDEGEDEDRKRRKLAKTQRKQKEKKYIDCDQCFEYDCYNNNQDEDGEEQDDEDNPAANLIEGLAGCKQTGDQWNNMNVYAGLICASYGDGIEVGAFLDEDCTMYTNQVNSYNTLKTMVANNGNGDDDEDEETLERVETLLKLPFEEAISCDGEMYNFDDPDEEDNEEEEDDGDDGKEVSEVCEDLFGDESASLQNCGNNGDEEEEEEEDDDDNGNNYDWYTYDLDGDEDDMQEVCQVVLNLEGEYVYVYDEEGSGSWYERDRHGNIIKKNQKKNTVGRVFLILFLLLVAGTIGFFAYRNIKKRRRKQNSKSDPLYTGGPMA